MDSIVGSFIHAQYDRGMNAEEDEETIGLIKGKIPELELKFKEFLREKEKSSKEGYTISFRTLAIS